MYTLHECLKPWFVCFTCWYLYWGRSKQQLLMTPLQYHQQVSIPPAELFVRQILKSVSMYLMSFARHRHVHIVHCHGMVMGVTCQLSDVPFLGPKPVCRIVVTDARFDVSRKLCSITSCPKYERFVSQSRSYLQGKCGKHQHNSDLSCQRIDGFACRKSGQLPQFQEPLHKYLGKQFDMIRKSESQGHHSLLSFSIHNFANLLP